MIDAIILCGGQGTRVRYINPDLPKVLFPVEGRPFLDFVLTNLYFYGYRRFILATGYLDEKIQEYARKSPLEKHILVSSESIPLGTAGAIKNAGEHINSDDFLVLNGDSLVKGNIKDLVEFHFSHQDLATVALTKSYNRTNAGNVDINSDSLVVAFNEKNKKRNYINAGLYIFYKTIFLLIPEGFSSLEEEILPDLVQLKALHGFPIKGQVIDIGTEERYSYVSG